MRPILILTCLAAFACEDEPHDVCDADTDVVEPDTDTDTTADTDTDTDTSEYRVGTCASVDGYDADEFLLNIDFALGYGTWDEDGTYPDPYICVVADGETVFCTDTNENNPVVPEFEVAVPNAQTYIVESWDVTEGQDDRLLVAHTLPLPAIVATAGCGDQAVEGWMFGTFRSEARFLD